MKDSGGRDEGLQHRLSIFSALRHRCPGKRGDRRGKLPRRSILLGPFGLINDQEIDRGLRWLEFQAKLLFQCGED